MNFCPSAYNPNGAEFSRELIYLPLAALLKVVGSNSGGPGHRRRLAPLLELIRGKDEICSIPGRVEGHPKTNRISGTHGSLHYHSHFGLLVTVGRWFKDSFKPEATLSDIFAALAPCLNELISELDDKRLLTVQQVMEFEGETYPLVKARKFMALCQARHHDDYFRKMVRRELNRNANLKHLLRNETAELAEGERDGVEALRE
jgi:hypothetical protein